VYLEHVPKDRTIADLDDRLRLNLGSSAELGEVQGTASQHRPRLSDGTALGVELEERALGFV